MLMNRRLLLPIALLQPVAAYLPVAMGAPDMGERATADGIPPELPSGIFFAIWGVIYLAYIGFALYAFLRDTEISRQLSGPLIASGLIAALFMVIQQAIGAPILDLLVLIPFVWLTWLAALRFDRMRGLGGSPTKLTADILTGLLSGWAVVALAISVPRAARTALDQGPTDSEWVAFLSVLFVIGIATAAYKAKVSRTIWYYFAASWGLFGILVNNWTRTGFGYFGWITLVFGLWLVYHRLAHGANGSIRLPQNGF